MVFLKNACVWKKVKKLKSRISIVIFWELDGLIIFIISLETLCILQIS